MPLCLHLAFEVYPEKRKKELGQYPYISRIVPHHHVSTGIFS